MAQALLICVIAAIAAVFGYMSWDISVSVDREVRRGRVAAARRARAREDAAWVNRSAHYAAAQEITLRRAGIVSARQLADVLAAAVSEVVA